MSETLIITPTLLRQFLMCERLAWLERYGDSALRDPIDPALERRLAAGVAHEEAVHEAAGAPTVPVVAETWEEGIRATRELMEQGAEVITGAYLERWLTFGDVRTNVMLRGRADRLVRKRRSVSGRSNPFSRSIYQPVEIKRYPRIGLSDQLQLDAYLWMLQESQSEAVDGFFLMGERAEGVPAFRQAHELDELRLMKWVGQLAKVLAVAAAPPVRIEQHCKTCRWYSSCKAVVEPSLPISLLSGLSQQARDHLRASGISNLRQIVEMKPEELKRFRGIKTTAPAIHAHARAHVEKQPVWFDELPQSCFQPGIMFDLETDPYTQKPWSWGWCDSEGNTQVILTAHKAETVMLNESRAIYTVRDTDAAWRLFAELNPKPAERIYHWTGYDSGVMRANAPYDVKVLLDSRMVDLHRIYKHCVRFPVDGASLKVVARYLDYQWAEYDAWDAAYNDYRRWLSKGDLDALRRACNYQQADVQALAVVWNWLVRESR
ncbi:MAG: TM0106 family RecB-like putative nuclease [Chloroflexota bacterium]